jgi:hypothetical protein
MTTNVNQIKCGIEESRYVPIYLEFDFYLFEAYLNNRIEDEILQMMEPCDEKPANYITIRPIYTPNKL